MEEKKYCTAVVLAAGSGKRMGTKVHKQYLLMGGKPVIYYSLRAFEASPLIDEIILVCGVGEVEYCQHEIVDKYRFSKVHKIISGGAERYDSVWNGLQNTEDGYVYIHDGARPFVDEKMIERAYNCVSEYHACAAGMPSKDTVKIADSNNVVTETPDRSNVWVVQTPQVFDVGLIKKAYAVLMDQNEINVTDDAMVAEQMLGCPVRLFYGSYENIKITTPEDLEIAEVFLKRKS